MKNTLVLFSIILVSLLLLVIFWEFYLEDPILFQLQIEHMSESMDEKVEYVVTVFIFGVMSLFLPFILSFQAERRRKILESEREHLIFDLRATIEEIKRLNGVIPVCSYCKKIRNEEGDWEELERYIVKHSDVDFSHGACPVCYQQEMKKIKNTSLGMGFDPQR